MRVQRFDLARIAATPWKNGGGATRELACWPPGAGLEDFDWRISVATIAASGPFSMFPGIDRVIVLLSGDGVQLRGPGVTHRLDKPLVPRAFGGEAPIDACLNGGPSQDFNVMARRARCQARVEVLRASNEGAALPCDAALILMVEGVWLAALPGETVALAPGQGLWWPPGQSVPACPLHPVKPMSGAAALLVEIRYQNRIQRASH